MIWAIGLACAAMWALVIIGGVMDMRRSRRVCQDCGLPEADHDFALNQGHPDPCQQAALEHR